MLKKAPEKLWWGGTAPQDFYPDDHDIRAAANLTELADVFGSDKGTLGNAHNYARLYERLINPSETKALCEIGVACGASLKMWSAFLPAARIVGVDIRDECKNLCKDNKNIEIKIGDVKDLNYSNKFDVVIDDASHVSEDIVDIFHRCWKWVRPGGLYIIEDVGCTYSDDYTEHFNSLFGTNKVNNRNVFVELVDSIMKNVDAKIDIESMEYHPQLLIMRKRKADANAAVSQQSKFLNWLSSLRP